MHALLISIYRIRPSFSASGVRSAILHLLLPGLPRLKLLVNEERDQADSDNKDDAEDKDDTGFLASPVSLGELGDGRTGDNGVRNGRHFAVWEVRLASRKKTTRT